MISPLSQALRDKGVRWCGRHDSGRGAELPVDAFASRQTWCRACHATYWREHHEPLKLVSTPPLCGGCGAYASRQTEHPKMDGSLWWLCEFCDLTFDEHTRTKRDSA